MGVKLEGLEMLMRHIAEIGKNASEQTVEKAVKAGGELLMRKVEESAPAPGSQHPYATGNLKENIIVSDYKNGEVNVGPDQQGTAFYGHMLEFGTVNMDAKPFMGPALENNKAELEAKMVEVLKRELGL
ncbi:HK97 gp10 family phage protein [Bacillus sp. ISL-40]|uniref:HK97-gp10 family putative phage morphogenesis protein n=1 Tax=unclassified Bacillus (in: firmicutes) TaxID=185979 RepID=UPI001BE6F817|nr:MULTISPECIES: HK97-gp10 family putative phage morphogenesis protein [unclassified Bacillus (in: firmicutes)]MBT2696347.1 HK97 gp10 family phage protein [Bacillus sp. ISL-40]MBT2743196.1 HK97 gp10 family phage protein [Bacillus sp. ISL-77]